MRFAPYGLHHTVMVQPVKDRPGFAVPVLYLKGRDGAIFAHTQLHEYFIAHRNMSLQWMRDTARALGLFWDFMTQIESEAKTWNRVDLHRALFRAWCEALQFGTINVETKLDPLGLFWPSTSVSRAKLYVQLLQEFITWTFNEAQGKDEYLSIASLAKLPPSVISTLPTDSKTSTRFLVVAHKLKEVSFLHHLKEVRQDAARLQRLREQELYLFGTAGCGFHKEPFKFMEPEIVAAMLKVGFIRNPASEIPEEREDITAKMSFLLQAFGGCRMSEPCHLWFNDIVPEGDFTCRVFLRHPSEARTYFVGENMTRREYLARLGMLPRNQDKVNGWYGAGWKHLAVDKSMNAPIFWLHPGAEALFTALYNYYLTYRARLLERRRLRGLRDHPFLLVSAGEDRDSGESKVGDPYSMAAFNKAFGRALAAASRELGVELVRKKESGTTPHALRHFFGQTLIRASQHQKVIQRALRHRSPLSQEPYTVPDFRRVNEVLNSARQKVLSGEVSGWNLEALNSLWK